MPTNIASFAPILAVVMIWQATSGDYRPVTPSTHGLFAHDVVLALKKASAS